MKNVHLMTQMVVNAYHELSAAEQYKEQMQPSHFRKKFGTVKISLKRGSGHTSAALQLLERFKDSLLIVESSFVYFEHARRLQGQGLDRISNRIVSVPSDEGYSSEIIYKYFAGKHWSLLIIDPAEQVLEHQSVHTLVQTVNHNYDLLVLLG